MTDSGAAVPPNGLPSQGSPTLLLRGLRKSFADVVAVDGLDLEVMAGRMLWVTGAQWRGKDDDH